MRRGGSQPGERRGGRKPGTPNRATADVIAKLAAVGCDPIEGMAKLAMDPQTPIEIRARMFAELATYVAPKRKSVENQVANSQIAGFVILGTGEAVSADAWMRDHAPQRGA